MTPGSALLLALASALGGAINSIAGGGTLVAFPVAMAVGLPPLVANATNAVAMTPGSLASAWAYRREVATHAPLLRGMLVPASLGALVGSALLLATPPRWFDYVVPALIGFATLLLLAQNVRPPRPHDGATLRDPRRSPSALALQFGIGVYGGYFGAGMGIMMLAVLVLLGARDIHGMNGVKNVLAVAINGIATLQFVLAGAVDARAALVMASGATLGGFVGAKLARKVAPTRVRWAVVAIGVCLTARQAAKLVWS